MTIIKQGQASLRASVPALLGCVAIGETREEVTALIQEAIVFHLEARRAEGQAIPQPVSSSQLVEVEA